MNIHFADRLTDAIARRRTCAVVGLDPVYERLPAELRSADASRPTLAQRAAACERFCREVVRLVAPHVPMVKINSAFFEAFGAAGVAAYFRLIADAHANGLLVIGDVKRGDIGSTATLYALGHLSGTDADDADPAALPDAVTLAGYLGAGAVQPFIDAARQTGRGLFVLVRPSDPGADVIHEFRGAAAFGDPAGPVPPDGFVAFYEFLADLVRAWGEQPGLIGECGYSCVGAVVAPKGTASTRALRQRMPRTIFLVPGYGAQGGTAEACRACLNADGSGAVINASRSVIFAFEQPEYAQQFAGDWRAAIAAACRAFVADLAELTC